MNSILVKAVMLLSLFYSLICSDLISSVYCNPGLKLGVQFGRKPEFILGFENSITAALYYGWPYAGIVGGIEFNFGQRKIVEYWEVEFGFTRLELPLVVSGIEVITARFEFWRGLVFLSYKHLINTHINELSFIGKYPYGFYQRMDHGTYLFDKR